jgi:rSAM/selenodomain-associated transferase 1
LTENAFILFLKYPERGAVKTRLTGALGDDLALDLYSCFLTDISVMTRQVNAETIIVYSGPEGVSFSTFPGAQCLLQRGADIGERMYFAFLDVFSQGFERCMLMGSDIPDLPAGLVNNAFNELSSVDIVLGPSTDGGYYLIGCKQSGLRQSIFSGIPWSTAGVFSETLRRVAESGLAFAQLSRWSDIDELDDLKKFYEKNSSRAATSQVMKFLNANKFINQR